MNSKQKISLAMLMLALGIGQTQAQLDRKIENAFGRAADRTTDRATQRVENKVNQKVNQTVDKNVDKAVDKAMNPNLSGNKSKTTSTTTTTTTSPSNGSNPSNPKDSKTDKTTITSSPSTTTTTSSADKDAKGLAASSFTGSFQWEVKRYKNNALVANGNSMLRFLVKPYEIAIQELDIDTGEKGKGYIYDRKSQTLISTNDADKSASKSNPKINKGTELALDRSSESRKINGHECQKYTASNEQWDIVLWVDEADGNDLFSSFRNGIGVSRPDLDIIPFLASVKTPVREAIVTDKKKGEKTQLWLQSISKESPSDKEFDYSKYKMR